MIRGNSNTLGDKHKNVYFVLLKCFNHSFFCHTQYSCMPLFLPFIHLYLDNSFTRVTPPYTATNPHINTVFFLDGVLRAFPSIQIACTTMQVIWCGAKHVQTNYSRENFYAFDAQLRPSFELRWLDGNSASLWHSDWE